MSENTRTPGDYGTGALQELRGCLLRADQIYPSSSVIGRSIAIVDELLRPHPADNAAGGQRTLAQQLDDILAAEFSDASTHFKSGFATAVDRLWDLVGPPQQPAVFEAGGQK
jgi:hypothetical protein